MTELTDLSETDASNTTITAIDIDEGCAPSGINNAIRNTLGLIRRAFKTSIFRLRDSTDQTKLLAFDLSALTTATTRTVTAPNKSGTLAMTSDVPYLGHLFGATLSNNAVDATNDIDVAAGEVGDTAGGTKFNVGAITKRLDAAWAVGTNQGGLDTGTVADATYHVYAINRPDTNVSDVLFSLSATAPTLPANYTLYRRIGAILRESGAIVSFVQVGDDFYRTPTTSFSGGSARAYAVLSIAVPSGIAAKPMLSYRLVIGSGTGLIKMIIGWGPTSATQSATVAECIVADTIASGVVNWPFTNASAQVYMSVEVSSGSVALAEVATLGWVDTRGRTA